MEAIMKRFLLSLILLAALIFPVQAVADGTVTESLSSYTGGMVVVTLTCTGDASDGSIPDTDLSDGTMEILLGNYYLYSVSAWPVSGGTAPDAADVFILDADGEDYLGSADGGTTAEKGANLIHATLKKTTMPYSTFNSSYFFFPVTSTLTLRVANQGTAEADYVVELTFGR